MQVKTNFGLKFRVGSSVFTKVGVIEGRLDGKSDRISEGSGVFSGISVDGVALVGPAVVGGVVTAEVGSNVGFDLNGDAEVVGLIVGNVGAVIVGLTVGKEYDFWGNVFMDIDTGRLFLSHRSSSSSRLEHHTITRGLEVNKTKLI